MTTAGGAAQRAVEQPPAEAGALRSLVFLVNDAAATGDRATTAGGATQRARPSSRWPTLARCGRWCSSAPAWTTRRWPSGFPRPSG
ncbi:hypothetical protein [Amycolatopsis sp. ATCC 39116]|uniref:hypothetical protein n=1 Tax=Amycolatopsis sp. (strain ATCC 39116 / 75iv2) TaxID=385957 RepID=UPI0002629001|nr:hypothetical protein [Amycolatopsis sp. ATCC 39116]